MYNLQEAILCVKELQSPKNIHMFVTSAMNQVLERSMQARQQCGGLLRDLVKQEVITEKSYVKGYVACDHDFSCP